MKGRGLYKKEEPNGMPAFAGMTALVTNAVCKKHRHAREGGHPIFLFLLFLFLTLSPYASAQTPLPDPALEARAIHLGEELRCVVCQSESINDSQADMARDMRILVREKISRGWSDPQILAFLRDRYGDFILLNPPFQMNTYVLWGLPILFLGGAGLLLAALFRRRKESA